MDDRFRLDHIVMSRTRPMLTESEAALTEPVGELAETLSGSSRAEEPSEVERLIGVSLMESMRARGMAIDGAFHGVFDDDNDLVSGRKTIDDMWKVIPYENYIVTAELTAEEIKEVMEETYTTHERRSIVGLSVRTEGSGAQRRVTGLSFEDGRFLERGRRYVIAFNTFDSRSGGHRFMKLRSLLEGNAVNCRLHDVQTRDALIEYFRRHRIVHKIGAPLPAAA
jgi:2',3'-cyclic-nucleotide 2'-phosphodiesterase (5'-nucleotidase family)